MFFEGNLHKFPEILEEHAGDPGCRVDNKEHSEIDQMYRNAVVHEIGNDLYEPFLDAVRLKGKCSEEADDHNEDLAE